jgi:hypothetical protein
VEEAGKLMNVNKQINPVVTQSAVQSMDTISWQAIKFLSNYPKRQSHSKLMVQALYSL